MTERLTEAELCWIAERAKEAARLRAKDKGSGWSAHATEKAIAERLLGEERLLLKILDRVAADERVQAQAREALKKLMRVEPYVYEGRLEASLTIPVETWDELTAALAALGEGGT